MKNNINFKIYIVFYNYLLFSYNYFSFLELKIIIMEEYNYFLLI